MFEVVGGEVFGVGCWRGMPGDMVESVTVSASVHCMLEVEGVGDGTGVVVWSMLAVTAGVRVSCVDRRRQIMRSWTMRYSCSWRGEIVGVAGVDVGCVGVGGVVVIVVVGV